MHCIENVNFYEDYIVMLQLFYVARKIEYIPCALYYYVKYNEKSYNHSCNEKVLSDMISSVSFTFDFIKENNLFDFQYDAIYRALNIKFGIMSLVQKVYRKKYDALYLDFYKYRVRFLLDWNQSFFNKCTFFFALNYCSFISYFLLDLKKMLKRLTNG